MLQSVRKPDVVFRINADAIGLAFPQDFLAAMEDRSLSPTVILHVEAAVPPQLRQAFATEVQEIGWGVRASLAGQDPDQALPVAVGDLDRMVLGEDRAGRQVPLRDKLRPMLAILILMLGSVGIAGLVAVEIEQRTVSALLVTPCRAGDLLAAKGITGAILGVSQVAVFMVGTLSFGAHPGLVALLLLLGALMMAAVGLIAGTAGRDFMTTMFLAIVFIVPMSVPTFAALFPGSTALWVQAMPSWGFVEAMVGLLGYGRSPADVAGPVALAAGWTVGLLGLALVLLRRRVETA